MVLEHALDVYHAQHRFLDAENRNFVTVDPVKDRLNWYAYCEANPATCLDPLGLEVVRHTPAFSETTSESSSTQNSSNRSGSTDENNRIDGYSRPDSIIPAQVEHMITEYNSRLGCGTPTILQAWAMVEHLYAYYDSKRIGFVPGGWMFMEKMSYHGSESLLIGVYAKVINGATSYVVVNKGTDMNNFMDWKNNVLGQMGRSTDINESIAWARNFVEQHQDAHITFVGHSKGGLEAQINAFATDKNAIIFNPMSFPLVNYPHLVDNIDNYSALMMSYVVNGDILNEIFGSSNMRSGNISYLPAQSPVRNLDFDLFESLFDIPAMINNHVDVSNALKEANYR